MTLVERKGDWLRALPVASRKSEEVGQAVVQALQDIPPPLRKTIPFDNGSAFADHGVIAQELNVDIYFAHPYSAYERGRNENANGLLRQYVPKGMSFESVTLEQLEAIVANATTARGRNSNTAPHTRSSKNSAPVSLAVRMRGLAGCLLLAW